MKKILARIFWIVVILFMCLWTYEFYRVRNGKDPQFCLKNEIMPYSDGVTEKCVGLGYKVYHYRRTELKGREFVSLFAKERKEEIDNYVPEIISEEEVPVEGNQNEDLPAEEGLIDQDIEVVE